MVDHLFRHHYGKMVAILVKVFGPAHLETIEDAIQDTFMKASLQWRNQQPENPEAWLTQAAKNRVLDIFRQVQAREKREISSLHGSVAIEVEEIFLEHEIQDSQLRMLFLACNPIFSRDEQICFALKSISGFSGKEIASALLQKEETVKKRLSRARRKIKEEELKLEYPDPSEINFRLRGVMQIIYLIFNEGFHSNKPELLINKDLCGEALRLCKLLLSKNSLRDGSLYALFALLCFNSARLDTKVNNNEIVDLKNQDRTKWYKPLIDLGRDALIRALGDYPDRSTYHFEALIAFEHCLAKSFKETNWDRIMDHYSNWYKIQASDSILLSQVNIHLAMEQVNEAELKLRTIRPAKLEGRRYLYEATKAEILLKQNRFIEAKESLLRAIELCTNSLEIEFLQSKLQKINN